jgi:hypothetical protein
MPDPDPLNSSELRELERRLKSAPLSPTPRERERLLYACGQAAGRAQMMRRVRSATTIAALLGCTCASLFAALVLREQSPHRVITGNPARPVPEQAAVFREEVRLSESSDGAGSASRQLAVGRFAELALAERPQKAPPSREPSAMIAVEPTLSAAGPLPVEL